MSKFIRYSTMIVLVSLLGACSGNPDLENRLAADPNLPTNPLSEISPSPSPTSNQLPANFPAEIPQYSQSELLSVQTNPDNTGVQTRWQSNDPSNAIEAFYQQELTNNNWEIITPFSGEGVNSSLTARRDNLELTITITSTSPNTEYSLDYRQGRTPVASPLPSPISSPAPNLNPSSFNDIESLPEPIKTHIQDLSKLGVLTGNNNQFNPNNPITRREFARWLLQANNAIYGGVAGKQIRLATANSTPTFSDVKTNDPDYNYIQGLAEAGLIPSPLTGNSSALLFRPNASLTREDLIAWKVPLDMRKALPSATLDTIKNTWGFQDTNKINPQVVRALYADFQNGDQANIRRVFGFTTLFQPQKTVTRAEAATALWYLGFQGDGLSAADALQGQNSQSSAVN